jgi:drug/metabolite transporter (DMT)-like permease
MIDTRLGDRWQIVLAMVSTVALAVVGVVLLKIAASKPSADPLLVYGATSISWLHVVSVAFLVAAALAYTLLLRFVPLYVAQRVAAVQFGAIILAGAFFLGEDLSPIAWIGISLIAIGIVLMGRKRNARLAGG